MLLTLSIAMVLSLSIALFAMPKAVGFVLQELQSMALLARRAPGAFRSVIVFELTLAIATFLIYKLSLSLWAYCLSGDIIEHFVLSRGVFNMETGRQFAFSATNLLMFFGSVGLKLSACYFLYNQTGYFLTTLQSQYLDAQNFNLGLQILLSFAGTLLLLSMEVMFLAQHIAPVSKYSNLLLLTIANLSFIAFFVCSIHLRYKRDHPEYFADLQTYVDVEERLLHILRKDVFSVLGVWVFGVFLHLPHYFGLQFLEDNVVLVLMMLAVMLMFVFVVFRRFFIGFFDVLTRIFLLPHFGSEPLTVDKRLTLHRRVIWLLLGALFLAILAQMPSLLSFVLMGSLVAVIFGGAALILISLPLRFITSTMHWRSRDFSVSFRLPRKDLEQSVRRLRWQLALVLTTLRPGLFLVVVLAIVLIARPKAYQPPTTGYSQTVFGRDSAILDQRPSVEGYLSVPIGLSMVPRHFVRALLLQEDRGLERQHSWLPNHHNWFGISATAMVRFVTREGGGSNITNQLCKNEVFHGTRVRDVQRKFFELIASFQMALSSQPEEQLEWYLNRVSMFGGRGQKGLFMASMKAFGKPASELNGLQSLMLIRSLQYGVALPLLDGRRIPYDSLVYYENDVRQALLARYELWVAQGVVPARLLPELKVERLFSVVQEETFRLATSTRDMMRKSIPKDVAVSHASISVAGQRKIRRACARFESRMRENQTKGHHQLLSAALAIDCRTGEVLAHHGGEGISDLSDFGQGFQMGSIMKPFILIELLEEGLETEEVRLYDGARPGQITVQNFSRRYSNKYVGLEEMLAKSLNAPFHNLSELRPAMNLFRKVERRFENIGISPDPSIDLGEENRFPSYRQNYPLGLRRMTLLEVARAYQPLFNDGFSREISALNNGQKPGEKVYSDQHCEQVRSALRGTVRRGGTGTHFVKLLPRSRTFYAKTGTSDEAIHGWTILSDGELLIVAFVTYGAIYDGRLELNKTPAIPTGSGAQTAGVLAALIYNELSPQKDRRGKHLLAFGY